MALKLLIPISLLIFFLLLPRNCSRSSKRSLIVNDVYISDEGDEDFDLWNPNAAFYDN